MKLSDFQIYAGTGNDFDRGATKARFAYEVEDLESWGEKLEAHDIKISDGVKIRITSVSISAICSETASNFLKNPYFLLTDLKLKIYNYI